MKNKEVNKYSLNKLKEILNIKETINVKDDEEFDFLRILSMKHHGIEQQSKNILFFPVLLDQKMVDDGWIYHTTDLKTPINEIVNKFNEYTFVVEEDMVSRIEYKDAKLIVVDDIMKSIDKLYDYQLANNKFEVITATGSAGKTTTIGLVEDVLSTKYKVLRIYSDRITPILLKAYIINFLNPTHDIVALEMGIYFKDHVKVLSELINPDVSAMINIGNAHLGTGGLNTIDDICKNKAYVLKTAKKGFINRNNDYLARLSLKDNKIYYDNDYLFDTNLNELTSLYPNEVKRDNEGIILDGHKIKIPFLTELSIIQYLIVYNIGKYYNVDEDTIVKVLNDFKPVENRLQRATIFGKNVIFDGDSSFKERIHQLSLHLYDKCYLVIRKYGDTKAYDDDLAGIVEYFDKFDKVYIFEGINYFDELKNHPNVEVVNNHDFMKTLDGEIFYHYHEYCYKFDKISDENLEV